MNNKCKYISARIPCSSGFGDRLLDIWSVVTIAHLRGETAKLHLSVCPKGLGHARDTDDYRLMELKIPKTEIVSANNPDATLQFHWGPQGKTRIENGELFHAYRNFWGAYSPPAIWRDYINLKLHKIQPNNIVQVFQNIAHETQLPIKVADRTGWVGVHIRRTDKIKDRGRHCGPHEMTDTFADQLHNKLLSYLKQINKPLLFCGDDAEYMQLLKVKLGSGKNIEISRSNALEDILNLAACDIIVQGTIYSAFSMCASLLGRKPLVNFQRSINGRCHIEDIGWSTVVKLQHA